MDGLFPTIFHGERSELREKYGLGRLMSSSIIVVRRVTSSADGSDTREHITTQRGPWEVQISQLTVKDSEDFHIREDQVSLVNPSEQLQFPIGIMRELARFEDGTWETRFLPNLERVPEGLSVEIAVQSDNSEH